MDAGNLINRWSELFGNLIGLTVKQQEQAAIRLVEVARRLEKEGDRLAARDFIRGVLNRHREFAHSAAMADANGAWPPGDVIERVKSKELEIGFQIGTRNRRGTTSRGPLDGGDLERDLKSHYDALAKKFRISAPRTAMVLRMISSDYKVEAVFMDQLSESIDLI